MILEFISMKDPHFAFGFANRIRFDYENDVSKKIEFVKNYVEQHKINHLIMTGDIIDSSYEDKWTFKKYRVNKRKFQSWADVCKLHSNIGNHDYFHGFENTDDTIFGEMVEEGVLSNLTQNPIIVRQDEATVVVQGIDYSFNQETVKQKLQIYNDSYYTKNTFKIVVLHSNVTPNEVKHITDFTYKSLVEDYPDIDMFICGHYHLGYVTKTFSRPNGKNATFINNWNFVRVVRDYQAEMGDHTPEFEHVQIHYDKGTESFSVRRATIEVPHKEYNETFRSKEVNLLRKTNSEKFNFFDEINIESLIEGQERSDEDQMLILNDKRSEHGYSPFSKEVLEIAIQYLNN